MSIKQAFKEVCDQAIPAQGCYVSLYVNVPYYGGPEEGGWWGQDTDLVAYEQYPCRELAEVAKLRVEKLAKRETVAARKQHDRHCLQQCEWLDERGLDSDYLPEVSGSEDYFVVIEDQPGEYVSKGCRHYE